MISNTRPDFEISATLPSSSSTFNWTVKFHCTDQQWKWSEDAPHSWKITRIGNLLLNSIELCCFIAFPFLLEGLNATNKTGHVHDSLMKIDLLSESRLGSNGPSNFVQVQADLFLCAIKSGVCKKKSVVVRLNLILNDNTQSADMNIQHEFNVNAE